MHSQNSPRACTRCLTEKNAKDFYRKSNGTRHSWCKPCFNAYCMSRWKTRKLTYIALLGGKCSDCEGVFPRVVYDFHHVGKKDVSWDRLRLRSDAAIRRELKKCILLCSNCHRVRHADED